MRFKRLNAPVLLSLMAVAGSGCASFPFGQHAKVPGKLCVLGDRVALEERGPGKQVARSQSPVEIRQPERLGSPSTEANSRSIGDPTTQPYDASPMVHRDSLITSEELLPSQDDVCPTSVSSSKSCSVDLSLSNEQPQTNSRQSRHVKFETIGSSSGIRQVQYSDLPPDPLHYEDADDFPDPFPDPFDGPATGVPGAASSQGELSSLSRETNVTGQFASPEIELPEPELPAPVSKSTVTESISSEFKIDATTQEDELPLPEPVSSDLKVDKAIPDANRTLPDAPPRQLTVEIPKLEVQLPSLKEPVHNVESELDNSLLVPPEPQRSASTVEVIDPALELPLPEPQLSVQKKADVLIPEFELSLPEPASADLKAEEVLPEPELPLPEPKSASSNATLTPPKRDSTPVEPSPAVSKQDLPVLRSHPATPVAKPTVPTSGRQPSGQPTAREAIQGHIASVNLEEDFAIIRLPRGLEPAVNSRVHVVHRYALGRLQSIGEFEITNSVPGFAAVRPVAGTSLRQVSVGDMATVY